MSIRKFFTFLIVLIFMASATYATTTLYTDRVGDAKIQAPVANQILIYSEENGILYLVNSEDAILDSLDLRILTVDTLYIYDLLDIPSGTTAQRPASPNSGMIRYNTDDNQYEGYDGSNWRGLGGVIDADQDTYIIAEKSSGSDEDTLYFHCDTTKVLTIGETEAVTYIPWSGFQNIEIEENAGEVTIMDMPVNTTDGLVQSYGFGIDNNTIMKIKAPADGSGGVDEKQALFVDGEIGYPGIAFIDDLDTGVDIVGSDSLGIFAGAWEGIRVDGTDSTLYFKGQVGDTLKLGKDGVFNGQITFYSDSATPDTCKIVISNYDRLMFWDAEYYWFDAPIYAPGYQGNSDFTIGASGEDVTFEADTLKGSPIWDGIFNCNDTVQAVILYDGTVSITGGDITGVDSMYIRTVKFQSGTDITEFSTDAGLGGDSDNAIPTEKAIKTYTDALVTAQDLDFSADSGTGAIDLDSETFKIKGTANEIVTSATGDSVTLDITILKDIVASGTGMSGGADDVLVGADSDVTITLTTNKDIVAGDGLGGGENDILPGADADVTITALLDVTGGLETVDDSINIKLDGATLTLSSSGIKVTDNTYEVQLDNEAG
ncbi:MAG: hypothetical protein H8D22_03940, partial [Candidatus Cloacimonetes bacterium]|nr:hypothetical protein [Candidatus Cloacimonadota bacterium]